MSEWIHIFIESVIVSDSFVRKHLKRLTRRSYGDCLWISESGCTIHLYFLDGTTVQREVPNARRASYKISAIFIRKSSKSLLVLIEEVGKYVSKFLSFTREVIGGNIEFVDELVTKFVKSPYFMEIGDNLRLRSELIGNLSFVAEIFEDVPEDFVANNHSFTISETNGLHNLLCIVKFLPISECFALSKEERIYHDPKA